MGYTKEAVIRARQILAQRKADRESESAARLDDAYRRFPRLQQIDIQLRQTMSAAAQAVFAQGGDVRAAMDQARAENQVLQAERKALIEANFAPE